MTGLNRAYSTLIIKALDESSGPRRFSGIASTITPDRSEDVVEPKGMRAKLPLPLLWQHDKSKPIGWVKAARVSDSQIEVECEMASVAEPGTLKDRLDEAWQSIKAGLVQGLSIGFSADPLKDVESIKGSRGLRFKGWSWLELSAVTIPANQEASILAIKAADVSIEPPAAPGKVVRLTVPGVSGHSTLPKLKESTVNIQDQIKSFEATRAAKFAALAAIMEKSEGSTLDAEQTTAYDDLRAEVKSIDGHLARLADMEKLNVQTAKPLTVAKDTGTAIEVKHFDPIIKAPRKADGLAMGELVRMLGRAKGNHFQALEMAKGMDNLDPRTVTVLKAAVAAGSTSNATWVGNLVSDENTVFTEFLEYLRPQTILGKFGTNGIPNLRPYSFRVPIVTQSSAGSGYWVGEGKAKPLTKFDFTRTFMEPLKVANIAVLTMEAIRDSSPRADAIVRDQLVAALAARLDTDFIDPAKAAVAGVSPASVTNGTTAIPSTSGTDAASVRKDITALLQTYVAANNPPSSAVLVMSSMAALAVSMMQNPLGQPEFQSMSMRGGSLLGIPVIVSDYVPTVSAGSIVVMINAADVLLGDEGGFSVDMSDQASLVMDSAPTMESITPAAAQLVSMWQTNSVAFRAERTINWMKARPSAVRYLSNVDWAA